MLFGYVTPSAGKKLGLWIHCLLGLMNKNQSSLHEASVPYYNCTQARLGESLCRGMILFGADIHTVVLKTTRPMFPNESNSSTIRLNALTFEAAKHDTTSHDS